MKRYDSNCSAELIDNKSNGVFDCACTVSFPFHVPITHGLLKYCTDEYIRKHRLTRSPPGTTQKTINVGFEQQLVLYNRRCRRYHERAPSPSIPLSPSQINTNVHDHNSPAVDSVSVSSSTEKGVMVVAIF